ncbi:MAG: type II toxin-antitoxin system RelE/ParE family toxin [Deltaproteobacteria bacterium]|jgi:addiction module RelE/StbE family toxin|nr:type II toxin-antitoxin system RelE/ParE family toxin [Deltaproteobacteria bacterium]
MIRWLPKAQENLNAELTRIAEEDEAAAKRIALIVKSRVESLEQFPESGRPGRIPGTRELVISGLPYLLPYRMRGKVIEILRFFHTAQKPPNRW